MDEREMADRESFVHWVSTEWRPDDGAELLEKDWPRFAFAAWQAARRTTPDREAIKNGYMLVPIEPDRAMLNRAVSLAMNVKISARYRWADYMRDLWAAFLEVAPAATPDRTVAASSCCDVHCKTFCQNSVHGMCDGVPNSDKGGA